MAWPKITKAALDKEFEDVKALVEAGADVNKANHKGITPLMAACFDVNNRNIGAATSIVEILLQQRANPNLRAANDEHALNILLFSRPEEDSEPLSPEFRQLVVLLAREMDLVELAHEPSKEKEEHRGLSVLSILLAVGHQAFANDMWRRTKETGYAEKYRRFALGEALRRKNCPMWMVRDMIAHGQKKMDLTRPVMCGLLAVTVAATVRSDSSVEFLKLYLADSTPEDPKVLSRDCRLETDDCCPTEFSHPLVAAIAHHNYENATVILKSGTAFSKPTGFVFTNDGTDDAEHSATLLGYVMVNPSHHEDKNKDQVSATWLNLIKELAAWELDGPQRTTYVESPIVTLACGDISDRHFAELLKISRGKEAKYLTKMGPRDYDTIVDNCWCLERMVALLNHGLIAPKRLLWALKRARKAQRPLSGAALHTLLLVKILVPRSNKLVKEVADMMTEQEEVVLLEALSEDKMEDLLQVVQGPGDLDLARRKRQDLRALRRQFLMRAKSADRVDPDVLRRCAEALLRPTFVSADPRRLQFAAISHLALN